MIYIIRHGQTDKNKQGLIQGQSDVPLNAVGEKQAEEAREFLTSQGIGFDRIYSSPLGRAVKTAEIVAGDEEHPYSSFTIAYDLLEMDYGPYEGVDLKNMPPEMKVFFSDFAHNPAPDGMEQLPDLVNRLGEFLEELKRELMEDPVYEPGENVLLSTHAIAMKAALEYLTPGSNGAYWSKYVPNCGIYRFDLVDGEFTAPEEVKYDIKSSRG